MSVCPVPDPKSRTERRWNLKIGRKNTGYPWPHFEVERSKVKVTRPINAVTDNQPNAPSIPCGKLIPKTGAISAENDTEREGLRTSNLVHGWSVDRDQHRWSIVMHDEPHHQHARGTPTWKLWVQSQLAEAGNILLRPHCFFFTLLESVGKTASKLEKLDFKTWVTCRSTKWRRSHRIDANWAYQSCNSSTAQVRQENST